MLYILYSLFVLRKKRNHASTATNKRGNLQEQFYNAEKFPTYWNRKTFLSDITKKLEIVEGIDQNPFF